MSTEAVILHQGRSLTLRRTMPEDAAFLYQQMYGNAEFMHLFRLNDAVQSEAELKERLLKRWQVSPAKSGYLELLILHQQHGPIGIVAAADYAPLHRRAEFLIGLFNSNYYHASYGIEASLMLGDLVFNRYNLHRFYAYSYAYNYHAHKCLMSGGFVHEGIMKEHVFDRVTQTFVDLHIFGMTVDQFRQNQRVARLSQRLIGRDITQPLPPQSAPAQQAKDQLPQFRKSGPLIGIGRG